MALLFLHYAPQVELVGITTVMGNASIEVTTRNALYLKYRFGIEAPVVRGADVPLLGPFHPAPAHIHGVDGLGDIGVPEQSEAGLDPRPAHKFIIDMVRAHPHEISLVAVGRMTNLALALREAPEIAGLVKEIVIMGGGFGFHGHLGNITPAAEANIHGDPLAADEIFAADWPLTVVGLDVTVETVMDQAYLANLRDTCGATGQFIWDISRLYESFYKSIGIEGICVHDSSAVAYLIAPDLFTTRSGAICVAMEGIAYGQTTQSPARRRHSPVPWEGRPTHKICIDVQREAFLDLYRTVIVEGVRAAAAV